MRNFWFQAHWLVGITAGIVLAVVGATGAILSFEHEILDLLNRDVRTVAPRPGRPLAAPELLERVQAASTGERIAALTISGDPGDAARVTFAGPGGAGGGPPGRPRGETRYVDPYTGTLIEGRGDRGEAFFRTTMSIHRWLTVGAFGDRDVGRQIVGACTILLVFLAASGLYLRWPRGRARSWRAWLTFDPRMKGRRFLWHLHAVIGTWVLALYLVMALTGLYWSYEWYRDGLYALTGAERPAPRGGAQREGGGSGAGTPAAAPDLDAAWLAFLRETGDTGYSTATFGLPRSPGEPVEIRYLEADPPHERAFNTLAVDATTGAVLRHERYAAKTAGGKLMASIFPLHSGSFFGLPGVVLYMLASLAMPLFAVTGWMLYLIRRRRERAAAAERAATRPTAAGAADAG